MEINRGLLRKNAWNSLKGIYWFMFLACLVAGIVGAINVNFNFNVGSVFNMNRAEVGSTAYSSADLTQAWRQIVNELGSDRVFLLTLLIIGGVMITIWILVLLFRVFLSGPATVSFVKIKAAAVIDREKDANYAFFAFRNNYLGNVKTMFLKSLYIFLWQLPMMILFYGLLVFAAITYFGSKGIAVDALFAIVGLMLLVTLGLIFVSLWKQYQYMLVPYILADDPSIKARDAIRLSSEMMQSFKIQVFVLRLSFIGWYLLGALCCGIGVLFVEPYYQATETLLYEELKAHYNYK